MSVCLCKVIFVLKEDVLEAFGSSTEGCVETIILFRVVHSFFRSKTYLSKSCEILGLHYQYDNGFTKYCGNNLIVSTKMNRF